MVAATYGFVSAFGQNIALIPTLTTGMKWFPHRKGLVLWAMHWDSMDLHWGMRIGHTMEVLYG